MKVSQIVHDVRERMKDEVLRYLLKERREQDHPTPEDLILEIADKSALVTRDDRTSSEVRVADGQVELLMNNGSRRLFKCHLVWGGEDHHEFDTEASSVEEKTIRTG